MVWRHTSNEADMNIRERLKTEAAKITAANNAARSALYSEMASVANAPKGMGFVSDAQSHRKRWRQFQALRTDRRKSRANTGSGNSRTARLLLRSQIELHVCFGGSRPGSLHLTHPSPLPTDRREPRRTCGV